MSLTTLLIALAHGIPIFLAGAYCNTKLSVTLVALVMCGVALATGGSRYAIFDLIAVGIVYFLCIRVVGPPQSIKFEPPPKQPEEKPKQPKSNFAVTGLYFFTDHVFELIPHLKVSARGELEVSHLNDWYVNAGTMTSTTLKGFWHDLGTVPSMLHAQDWINKNNYTIPFK